MAYSGVDAGTAAPAQHDRDVPASGDGRRRRPRRRLAGRPPRRRSPRRGSRRHRGHRQRSNRRRDAAIRFGTVIVCGGAIQTPALLQRSGLGRRLGATLAAHPTVKLAARFDDEVNVPDDVPVHQVSEFAPDLSFGGSASSPGLVALALSDHWSLFGDAVRRGGRSPCTTRRSPARDVAGSSPCPAGATRSSPTTSPAATGRCSAAVSPASPWCSSKPGRRRSTRRSAARRSFGHGATSRRCRGRSPPSGPA